MINRLFATTAIAATQLAASVAFAQNYQGNLTDLYNFTGGADGSFPVAPLAADSFHNLYGVTEAGAIACSFDSKGCGAIFKLNSQSQLSVLHDFTGGADGGAPFAGPILLREKLYGDTVFGGANGVGVIYSINIDGTGFTTLHSFTNNEGAYVTYPLLTAPGGGFYGIASDGGEPVADGTVFLWEPKDTLIILHDFTGGNDGNGPASLLKDSAGNLFGSTGAGGFCSYDSHGCGVIFEINATTRAYSVLYTFTGGADGRLPRLGSIGSNGTLYGNALPTTLGDAQGVLFSLTPTATGYQFSTDATIHPGINDDPVNSGPQPAVGGVMVGTNENSIYADQSGKVFSYVPNPTDDFYGPLTVAADGTLYGIALTPSFSGGTGSLGFLYSFTVSKKAK